MSADFNGTTSKLEHTTATALDYATMTICAWCLPDDRGENNFGRVLQADETSTAGTSAGNGWILAHDDNVDVMRFQYSWTTTAGTWEWPITDTAWNAVAMSYNRAATTNDPVARVNFASVTVTETVTPVGTNAIAPNTGYCIGNRTGQDRTWNGALEHIQVFNVILAAAEMDAALRKPGSITRGLVAWWPLFHATYLNQIIAAGPAAGTATDLADRAGAPCAMPWSAWAGWRGAYTAPAAPSGQGLLLSTSRNRLVRV